MPDDSRHLFTPGPAGTWRANVSGDEPEPPARRAGPETSKGNRARIMAYLIHRGQHGATHEEVSVALDIRLSSVCGRFGELRKLYLVRDSGSRRPTSSGRPAIVWVATRGGGAAP